ncbi:MAG TPA: LEPR-XLL domain-containing protein, partial [Opitutaceae bacterium]
MTSSSQRSEFVFEALEPRLLLSADGLMAAGMDPEIERDVIAQEGDSAVVVAYAMEPSSAQSSDSGDDIFDVSGQVMEAAIEPSATADEGVVQASVEAVASNDSGANGTEPDAMYSVYDGSSATSERLVQTLNASNAPPSEDASESIVSSISSSTTSDETGGLQTQALAVVGAGEASVPTSEADADAFAAVLEEARSIWAGILTSPELLERLSNVTFSVADLGAGILGKASGAQITLDDDAAGSGWFIDPTPKDQSEFAQLGEGIYLATSDSGAASRIDLLTVALHEVGHVLGLADVHGDAGSNVMSEIIPAGLRLLPTDAAISSAGSGAGETDQYAISEFTPALLANLLGGLTDLSSSINELIAGDELFGNHLPGLRLPDVMEGDVSNPEIRDVFQVYVDFDRDGSTPDRAGAIDLVNADDTLEDISSPDDIVGIVRKLSIVTDEEFALSLMDLNDDGVVSLQEAYDVVVVGAILQFLEEFPATKEVEFPVPPPDSISVPTDFSDLINGYDDFIDGHVDGFDDFLAALTEPAILNGIIDLAVSDVNNTSTSDAFSYDAQFDLTLSDRHLIDLGFALEQLEIDTPEFSYIDPGSDPIDLEARAEVQASMSLPLSFSVDRAGPYNFRSG